MTENIIALVQEFSDDPVLKSRSKLGLCRIWTGRVLELVKALRFEKQELIVEAREVKLEPELYHTFIQLKVGEKSYLWDGVGTAKYAPYFGPEDEAPEHLKNHSLDMISVIRNSS